MWQDDLRLGPYSLKGNPMLNFSGGWEGGYAGKGKAEGESEGSVNCDSPMKVLKVLEVGKDDLPTTSVKGGNGGSGGRSSQPQRVQLR